MSLLPLAVACTNNNNNPEYYFALNGGSSGPVTDSSFVATGTGSPPNGGTFTATSQDTDGNGLNSFVITDISGNNRWGIGVEGVEAGGDSGSDLAIFHYHDNGTPFDDIPLSINRASGGVTVNNGLTVNGPIQTLGPVTIDSGLTVDGENVLTSITDYTYTNSYNYVVAPGPFASGNYATPIGFTPTKTGMYLIEGNIGNLGNTITAALGDSCELLLEPVPITPGVSAATCGKILMGPTNTDFAAFQSMAVDKLIAGQPYTLYLQITNYSGTFAQAAGSLAVSIYLTALC